MRTQLKTLSLFTSSVLAALSLAGAVLSASPEPAPPQYGPWPTLAPDAPHWAARASSSVWLRYTNGRKEIERAAAAESRATLALSASNPAGVVFGQLAFNKDTSALPQNEASVAIDPRNANRIIGAYTDYRGLLDPDNNPNFTGWSTSTDGGRTVAKDGQLRAVDVLGMSLPSQGVAVVAADKNGNFFLSSLQSERYNYATNGITVFRSPAAGSSTGVFAGSCTGGTDPNCWPTVTVVAADTCDFGSGGHYYDRPYMAVDRSSSVASGSVYLVWTLLGCADGDTSTTIQIAKCTNNLLTCSAPVTLESTTGTGSNMDSVQSSHVTVGPTGKIYVTWVARSGNIPQDETDTIRLLVIAPAASPSVVGTLGPLRTVQTEASPLPWPSFPYPAAVVTKTYPKVGVRGKRAIIVWDRRTANSMFSYYFYLQSEIVAKFTDDDGASFSKVQVVSSGAGQRYQPTICVASPAGPVVVGYASHQNDPTWSDRQDWYVAKSSTGAAPYAPLRLTSVSNDTHPDPLGASYMIGDHQEVACQGNVGFLHFTANYAAKPSGDYFGGSGNALVRQQDTILHRFTLP